MVTVPIQQERTTAIVLPVGPGTDSTLDTLASISYYCPEPHLVVIVDDCTEDGTYERLLQDRQPHWRILRNDKRNGINRLAQTLCLAYRHILINTQARLVLRLDQDALLIAPGVISDALRFADTNPAVGLYGVYSHDYDRPRCIEFHSNQINTELQWIRSIIGLRPSWVNLLRRAEQNGWQRGENVFGGAYFLTRECLEAIRAIGALDVPLNWHSKMMEDVYFSMAAVAAGFRLGHFGAPEGPLCLEWRGLPYPVLQLANSPYKIVHSVDKGKHTGADANGGKTARGAFRELRNEQF